MKIKNLSASRAAVGAATPAAAKTELQETTGDAPHGKAVGAVVNRAGKRCSSPARVRISPDRGQEEARRLRELCMTLVFEKAGSVVIEVMVEEAETEPKAH